jgi:NIMA (never in mitosis gene a)-related kinase 2
LSGDTAQIGDFGLAMNIEDAEAMCLTSFRGTPYYMAPEMLQNKKYSQASDVWALGLVFLELTLKKRIHHILKGA